MSENLSIKVEVSGASEAERVLLAMMRGLTDRGPIHEEMAKAAAGLTQEALRTDPRHGTAERLGAAPQDFRSNSAKLVRSMWDGNAGYVLIPRNTGLGRAFHDVVLLPGSGRTYLTIPACAETYGKVVREFPEGTFKFAILHAHRPFPVLMFKKETKVAYWLRREVKQKQDRTLLPSDELYREVGRRAAVQHLYNLKNAA